MSAPTDDLEHFFTRERARHRAGLREQGALWGLQGWASDPTEGHHLARAKYGDFIVPVPVSMHRELTRRQLEEHPKDVGHFDNTSVRKGRLLLGAADLLEGFAAALRRLGWALIEGRKALKESDLVLQGLRRVLPAVEATFARIEEELRKPRGS